jgi:acetyl-CoA C-acetyltransferase
MGTNSEAVILSAARTPIGKFLGSLSSLPATRLGSIAVKAAVERAGVDAAEIEEILMGNVVQAGEGQAPARQAGIWAGVPVDVGATTVNKVCGSGLKAAMLAAQAVRAGMPTSVAGDWIMSRAPIAGGPASEIWASALTDALLHDGLWDPFSNGHGKPAEFIGGNMSYADHGCFAQPPEGVSAGGRQVQG